MTRKEKEWEVRQRFRTYRKFLEKEMKEAVKERREELRESREALEQELKVGIAGIMSTYYDALNETREELARALANL